MASPLDGQTPGTSEFGEGGWEKKVSIHGGIWMDISAEGE